MAYESHESHKYGPRLSQVNRMLMRIWSDVLDDDSLQWELSAYIRLQIDAAQEALINAEHPSADDLRNVPNV